MKRAVIFDLDGTLADSINYHFRIHKKVFSELGINLTKRYFQMRCNGTEPKEFYKRILMDSVGDTRLLDKAWNMMIGMKTDEGIDSIGIYPGVKTMLKRLDKDGYKMVVASSSRYNYVKRILDNNDITHYFDDIVGSDDFKLSKPDPSIFLEAYRRTGMRKKECVVIEDSINGIVAAKRARMDVISVLTTERIDDIPDYANVAERHTFIPDLISTM